MENFVSIVTCLHCGLPTDRNGGCVNCEVKITPYRLFHAGKMWLVFSDGDTFEPVVEVSCQRCGSRVIDDAFDEEGTCYQCKVHNMLKPEVLGQWYWIRYRVTMTPVTAPNKNVIERMEIEKVMKNKNGFFFDTDNPHPARNMGELLTQIKAQAGITHRDTNILSNKPGIEGHLGYVNCLSCGARADRVDKSCSACESENDIVIRHEQTGQIVVVNSTRQKDGKERADIITELHCLWCPDGSIEPHTFTCSVCGISTDVALRQTKSIQNGRTLFWHEARIGRRWEEKRPDACVKIIGVPAPSKSPAPHPNRATGAGVQPPPHTETPAARQQNRESPPSPDPDRSPTNVVPSSAPISTPQLPVVVRPQPPSVSSETSAAPKAKNLSARLFGRNPKKEPSARTKRRHSKAQRDADTRLLKMAARRLEKSGLSEREIAAALTEKFGQNIGKSKVRRLLNKD